MQVMESKYLNGQSKLFFLYSLGKYDEKILTTTRKALKDWQRLTYFSELITELKDDSGPLQGKGYMKNFYRRL
ncbi:MAG: hypothetical protein ACOCVB_02890 [Bacillota bacterium]